MGWSISKQVILLSEKQETDKKKIATLEKEKQQVRVILIDFAYCKGGNFNIHIWARFSYFIC